MAWVYLTSAFHFFRHPRWRLDTFSLGLSPTWFLLAALQGWRQRNERNFEPDYSNQQTFELEEEGLFRGTDSAARVTVPLDEDQPLR